MYSDIKGFKLENNDLLITSKDNRLEYGVFNDERIYFLESKSIPACYTESSYYKVISPSEIELGIGSVITNKWINTVSALSLDQYIAGHVYVTESGIKWLYLGDCWQYSVHGSRKKIGRLQVRLDALGELSDLVLNEIRSYLADVCSKIAVTNHELRYYGIKIGINAYVKDLGVKVKDIESREIIGSVDSSRNVKAHRIFVRNFGMQNRLDMLTGYLEEGDIPSSYTRLIHCIETDKTYK